jgi:hypothetical protein
MARNTFRIADASGATMLRNRFFAENIVNCVCLDFARMFMFQRGVQSVMNKVGIKTKIESARVSTQKPYLTGDCECCKRHVGFSGNNNDRGIERTTMMETLPHGTTDYFLRFRMRARARLRGRKSGQQPVPQPATALPCSADGRLRSFSRTLNSHRHRTTVCRA